MQCKDCQWWAKLKDNKGNVLESGMCANLRFASKSKVPVKTIAETNCSSGERK